MHYNGEGKVNAGQMFEVEDKPGVSLRNKSNAGMFNFDAPFTPNLKHVFKKAVSFIKAA